MSEQLAIAITGPAGAGKSTVAEMLAKRIEKCVNIEADHVKHFVVDGFSREIMSDGTVKYEFDQWELVGESIGLLAYNFLDKGRNVIINGYIDVSAWESISKHINLTHKFLLLPHIEIVTKRDEGRREDMQMGSSAVKEHHEHFSTDDFYSSFTKIDSTQHNIDDTVDAIMEVINRGRK